MSFIKKFIFIYALFFFFVPILFCREINPLLVKKVVLENGLTIYLNEDHSLPQVYGAVVVKAGSKYDPKDATGIAHYLEHMLFKGTDVIGTIDYQKEKPILDEIYKLYDRLGQTKDENERKNIQSKINELSIEDAKYGIPNEFSKLIQSMGGTGLNASTSQDYVTYYNFFPPQETEKWLDISSQRLINPAFRFFQSELETVYEEKNRSLDDYMSHIYSVALKNFYKNHPYGQQDTLGLTEHLKNPSLIKMTGFYNTYYVANNMALIITGDIDTEKIVPLVKEKFGRLPSGSVPQYPVYNEDPFKGREFIEKNISPVNIGIIAYRSIPAGHKDTYALQICDYLLNNRNKTGLLNKLQIENKLMEIGTFQWLNTDMGANVIYYVPKIIGQSLQNGEKLVMNEVGKIRKGQFDDDDLIIAKNNLKQRFESNLENYNNRSSLLINMFLQGKEWDDILSYPQKIESLTKNDIINAANKYYPDEYLCFYSRIGNPEKEKLAKPGYKPIVPGQNLKSEYAKKFEQIQSDKYEPHFIDFNNDIKMVDIKENVKLYCSKNPVNNLFSLEIRFGVGKHKMPLIGYAVDHMNDLGTSKLSQIEFKHEMEKLGCRYNFYSSDNNLNISLYGNEENLEKAIRLLNELILDPKPDQKRLNFKNNNEIQNRFFAEKKEPQTISYALNDYMVYKENSGRLKRLSIRELRQNKSENLINIFKQALNYEITIFYSGKKDAEMVKKIIQDNYSIPDNLIKSDPLYVPEPVDYNENTILFVNRTDARQSQVYFYIKGSDYKKNDSPVINSFNNYMSGGMNSLVFQEIREYRSLAYSTYAYYTIPPTWDKKSYITANVGCQADKTIEAVKIMSELLKNMPVREDKFTTAKTSLLKNLNNSKPTFRSISSTIDRYKSLGYENDPLIELLPLYEKLTMNDVINFYNTNIKGKVMVICIVGNKNKIDMKKLNGFGKIIMVDQNKLFRN